MKKSEKTDKKTNTVTAMEFSLRKLNYGMKTEGELIRRMKSADYPENEIYEAVSELKDFGYVDDSRYVEEFYKLGKSKGWSKNRVMRELSLKGIKAEIYRSIVDELSSEVCEEDEAFLIAKKMMNEHLSAGKMFDEKIKSKIGRRLISLGYNEGICYHVINKLNK